MWKKLDRLFLGLEWKLSLFGIALGGLGSFALPAWAAWAAGMFSQYAPFSWVAVGFAGLLLYALAIFLIGTGRSRSVRSKYDARFMQETGGVDPLAKVFEGKRIYLNDFILPSNPFVNGKNFVDCEIVGPANIFLRVGNTFGDLADTKIDAVALPPDAGFSNGYTFSGCSFRGCTFHRVTLFWSAAEAHPLIDSPFLNWISAVPEFVSEKEPTLIEDLKPQSSEATVEKKRS